MDLAQTLVRVVVRLWLAVEHRPCLEALVRHSALSLDDFRIVCYGTQGKDILKLLGRLREYGLVSVYSRQETKPNAQKATTVEYWYIDYPYAIDAIKYRLDLLQDKIRKQGASTTEKKDFSCEQCGSQWTDLDVMTNRDPEGRGSGFLCPNCSHLLLYRLRSKEETLESNAMSEFNASVEPIVRLLSQIDQVHIPGITGEMALERGTPIPRPQELDVGLQALPSLVNPDKARPTMGTKTEAERIEVTLADDDDDVERRKDRSDQNEMPQWFTHSTVSGQNVAEEAEGSDEDEEFEDVF